MALAELVTPRAQKVTLAYLERLVELRPGTLKDAVKRGSLSKPVAEALLGAAPRLGIGGLTADWLHYARGAPPYRGGGMPPATETPERARVAERSGGGYGDDAESGSRPPGIDLIEEIVHHPDQFARRLEKMAADIGVTWTIAWMDGAEKILRQNGLDYSAFFSAIRESLRKSHGATDQQSA